MIENPSKCVGTKFLIVYHFINVIHCVIKNEIESVCVPQCHRDSDSCTHYVIFNIDFVQLLVAKVTGHNQFDIVIVLVL